MRRKSREVDKQENPFESLQLITLHFDGSIVPRDLHGQKNFKGKLYFSDAGDVIYSKIDVRNGAIGIVPDDMSQVAVSSEFPVYEVLTDVAHPKYIKLLFRTQNFLKLLNSMVSGTSGRKRVQPSQIESLEIPLPPIEIQQAIVAKWETAQSEIEESKESIEQIEINSRKAFFKSLSLSFSQEIEYPKTFTVNWSDLSRWSVSYNRDSQTRVDLTNGKYPVVTLNSLIEFMQYGTSNKANTEDQGIPIIRMNNLVDGMLDLSDIKHIVLPELTIESLLLQKDDILINRTNSKELVGKCAVFNDENEYVFASYLIRFRVDSNQANPDYISYIINSQIGRQQIDALSRKITGQANINSDEIRSLEIPLPPLEVQQELVQQIQEARQAIQQAKDRAEQLKQEIESEIEEIILGTKSVTDDNL